MSKLFLIYLLIGAVIVFAFLRQGLRKIRDGKRTRGSEPGQGYTQLTATMRSERGEQTQRVWHVPKNPQDYAKIFVPNGRKRKLK